MMIEGKQLFGLDLGLSQIWEGEEALLNIPRLKKAKRAQGDSAQLLALPPPEPHPSSPFELALQGCHEGKRLWCRLGLVCVYVCLAG